MSHGTTRPYTERCEASNPFSWYDTIFPSRHNARYLSCCWQQILWRGCFFSFRRRDKIYLYKYVEKESQVTSVGFAFRDVRIFA